jgi:hypothetical protein
MPQYNLAIQNENLLDLVFANVSDVNSKFDLVEPDTFHPSLVIDLSIFLPSYTQSHRLFRNYALGDYVSFYNYLSPYDWSCVYNQSSTDSAVSQLNSVVTEALKLVIPYK